MKIALVHDYIKEFGGAERVLKTLSEMYPSAPIYTAFRVKNSTADKEFKNIKIIESWLAPLLKIWRLYSPLRFLAPVIWGSFDFSDYDLVITSCSWYITRGFKVGKNTKVIAYCHTPPRWLYGYEMSVGFTKYWPVKIYAAIVGHFMRIYDFNTAQKINNWIANSENVKKRIMKFYKKDSTVIYPPIDTEKIELLTKNIKKEDTKENNITQETTKKVANINNKIVYENSSKEASRLGVFLFIALLIILISVLINERKDIS